MYFTGQDLSIINLLFVGVFFGVCFLYGGIIIIQIVDLLCHFPSTFSFFKEKNKAGPP